MRAVLAGALALGATGQPLAAQGCDAPTKGSRWVAVAERAVPTHRYGTGGTWLATVAGVAQVAGKVIVFDEGKPTVMELSSTLEPVREWGRSGKGPGELSGIYVPFIIAGANYNFAGADAERVVVYDRNEIEIYDAAGTFIHSLHLPDDANPWTYGLLHVRPFGAGSVLAVIDSVDRAGRRPRRLQAWVLEGRAQSLRRTLLWETAVPSDTGSGLDQVTIREARPFWGRMPGCQVATDGSGRFLLRYDEVTARADSLPLPDWPAAEWGQDAERGINVGGRNVDVIGRPAVLARWLDLVVDPDGWAWVRGWTEDRGEVRVLAVSLASGATVEVRPPTFPRAFGAPGVFYGTLRTPDTDEILLIRYDGTRR